VIHRPELDGWPLISERYLRSVSCEVESSCFEHSGLDTAGGCGRSRRGRPSPAPRPPGRV